MVVAADVSAGPLRTKDFESMRVLVIGLNYSPEATGISPYTSALAGGLARRGVLVRALTAHPHYPEWKIRAGYGQWSRTESIDGVQVTRLRHYVPANPGGLNRLLSEVSFGLRLLFAPWGRPDVIVMVSPALFSTAIASLRARVSPRRPPVTVWVQDIYSLGITETGMGGGFVSKIVTWVERSTLAAAAGVVVIHERFGAFVSGRLGVPADRIEVVRNWTHLVEAGPVDVAAVRLRHGWNPNETVVLHAGNMGVKQGLENVVESARLAGEGNARVRFVLLGNGSQRDDLAALGAEVDQLQFIGSLDDVGFQEALVAADILLVNEKKGVSEMAVPSKLTSYFNAARPVIGATDPHGLTASEIAAANAGSIVPAGDPRALLDAVLELRHNPELAVSFGANGFKYRTEVLSETTAMDRFEDWLRTLTKRVTTRR
jgi:colanic acid biosynthesis glycosyl transferase WcaI